MLRRPSLDSLDGIRTRPFLALLLLPSAAFARAGFTVSMPQPSGHQFHIQMRCDGLAGEFQDSKMPAWMPGRYRMLDYAKHVAFEDVARWFA